MTLKERFDQFEDEFLKYERIRGVHPYRDIHAFLLLNQIVPGKHKMVAAAEHDQIWLDTNVEEFDKAATDEQICELVRCGVMYDSETDSLSMFV